jgi:hypothetical protein
VRIGFPIALYSADANTQQIILNQLTLPSTSPRDKQRDTEGEGYKGIRYNLQIFTECSTKIRHRNVFLDNRRIEASLPPTSWTDRAPSGFSISLTAH